jgi:hypothetical protein
VDPSFLKDVFRCSSTVRDMLGCDKIDSFDFFTSP